MSTINSKSIGMLAAGMLLLGSAQAAELVVIGDGPAAKRAGKETARLDFYSDGGVAAFQFGVKLPAGSAGVNTSKCLSGLPKSHIGACQLNKAGDMLAVVVYSTQNEALPSGTIQLGSITFKRSAAKGGYSAIEVQSALASRTDGSQETVELTLAQ